MSGHNVLPANGDGDRALFTTGDGTVAAMRRPFEVTPPSPSSPWEERVAWYLDKAFRIPGTNFRFGWDAILGLVPGLGDAVTGIFQLLLVVGMARRGTLPISILLRMLANVALDNTVGALPLVGDVFDFFFKANTRNVRLLRNAEEELHRTGRIATRRHVAYLWTLVLLFSAFVVSSVVVAVWIARWLFEHLPMVWS